MEKKHLISRVLPGSIAQELQVCPGDFLISVNDQPIEDIFDYRYQVNDEFITVVVEKADGEIWELEVEKEFEEDLGIEFANGLMDDYRSCRNRCIFCFIDQMPPGMRKTLYFKDDDARLSFLQGNYVTLTNMSDSDIDRIIRFHLEPINISFQAMDPALRCQMLRNRFAGEALKKVEKLFEAGIRMNGQIVLCRGVNDGDNLEYSLSRLAEYAPVLESVSIVPVGLTRYREGLYPLELFTPEDAARLLSQVRRWQNRMVKKTGMHFVHASDEWYILAGQPLPEAETYDGYLQLENGVGMLRLQEEEFLESLSRRKPDGRSFTASIGTGLLAAPYLEGLMEAVRKSFPHVHITVHAIQNEFFGETITVSGLITGQDLIRQLKGLPLGEALLLPCNMFRSQEAVFLDDVTVDEVEEALGLPIRIVEEGGEELLKAVLGEQAPEHRKRRQIYEQTGCGDRGET
ncbi:MAG: DUF512 domain-containing protein [Blautia sp.]|nr:DUF512 domain-containing protein [Blautia sp.]